MENTGTDDIGRLLLQLNLDQSRYKVFRDRTTSFPADSVIPDHGSLQAPEDVRSAWSVEKVDRDDRPPRRLAQDWTVLDSLCSPTAFQFKANSPVTSADPLGLPTLTLFGTCGGVGSTTIVSGLARVAAKSAQRVLLVDSVSPSLMPLHFGAQSPRSQISTFVPSGQAREGSIHVACGGTEDPVRALMSEIDSVYVDGGLFRLKDDSPVHNPRVTSVLVLVPDVRCLVELHRLQKQGIDVSYLLLNQFDATQSLHREVQYRLAKQFNHRLIPVTISYDHDVSVALAHGSTIIDYAPNSPVTEELYKVDEWLMASTKKAPELEPTFAGQKL